MDMAQIDPYAERTSKAGFLSSTTLNARFNSPAWWSGEY